jgi:hypothetical protein
MLWIVGTGSLFAVVMVLLFRRRIKKNIERDIAF